MTTLTTQDIQRLSQLAKLHAVPEKHDAILHSINDILTLVNRLQEVDTSHVEPLHHPVSLLQTVALPLHDDSANRQSTNEERENLLKNAPSTKDGLFLVPNVIE